MGVGCDVRHVAGRGGCPFVDCVVEEDSIDGDVCFGVGRPVFI